MWLIAEYGGWMEIPALRQQILLNGSLYWIAVGYKRSTLRYIALTCSCVGCFLFFSEGVSFCVCVCLVAVELEVFLRFGHFVLRPFYASCGLVVCFFCGGCGTLMACSPRLTPDDVRQKPPPPPGMGYVCRFLPKVLRIGSEQL